MIYAAIVIMWAVVLVPMWLRRRDADTEARSVDRFSAAMRSLSRRGGSPDRRYVVMPRRLPDALSMHVTGPRASGASGASGAVRPSAGAAVRGLLERMRGEVLPRPGRDGGPRPGRDGGPRPGRDGGSRPGRNGGSGRAGLVARRRRTLLGLAGAAVVGFLLAVAGVLPWWVQLLLDLVVAADVWHLRAEAKRVAVSRQRRRAMASTARTPVAAEPAAVSAAGAFSAAGMGAAGMGAAGPEFPEPAAAEAVATGTDGGWHPVPVPPPTYVTAGSVVAPSTAEALQDPPGAAPDHRAAGSPDDRYEDALFDEDAWERLDARDERLDDGSDLDEILSRQRAVGD